MCEIDRVSDKEGEPGCILCGSNDIEAERSINVECVIKLYK